MRFLSKFSQRVFGFRCSVFIVWFVCAIEFSWSSTPIRLTLWHGQGSNEAFWEETAQAFSRSHPNFAIDISSLPRKELNSSLTSAVLNDESPDMVLMQSDLLGLKSLFKLSKIPDGWLEDSTSKELEFFTQNQGNVYGVPISYGNHMLLFYNKALVDEPAKTWGQLEEQQKTLDENTQILAINYRSSYTFVTFWHAFGDQLVDGDELQLNNQNTIDTLNFYVESTQKKLFDSSCDYSCVSTDFFEGKFAYAINGDWGFENAKNVLGDNLGVALLPSVNGKSIVSMKSALVLSFPNYSISSDKKKGLEAFSRFVQGDQFADRVHKTLHAMPAHLEVRQRIRNTSGGKYAVVLEQLSKSQPMPPSVAMITAWDSISKGFKLFLDGYGSAEEIAEYMQRGADYEKHKVLLRELQ